MKLKEVFYLLGFRPQAREFGNEITEHHLAKDGLVQYAQWLSPQEKPKRIEQSTVDELRTFLRPGDVAVDIGAHTGDSTVPMALAVGPTGVVLALEPNPFVYRTLEANAGLNAEKTRIVPLNFAATPEDGEYTFEYSDASYCNGGLHPGMNRWKHAHAFPLKVQGKCLESYLEREHPDSLSRLRFIKTDLEGFDYEVLLSLRPLLERTRPFVKAEIYKHTPEKTRLDMLALFIALDYTVHHIESEAEFRGELLTPDNVNQWRHYDIFCVPNSVES